MHIVHLDQEDLLHDGNISVRMILNKYCLMETCKICFCNMYIECINICYINICYAYFCKCVQKICSPYTSLKKIRPMILGWKNRVFCPLRFKSTYEIISALWAALPSDNVYVTPICRQMRDTPAWLCQLQRELRWQPKHRGNPPVNRPRL